MVIADFTPLRAHVRSSRSQCSAGSRRCPGVDELKNVHGTSVGLYVVLLFATLLLGTAEVLRDNCGQTFMPSIVEVDQLEKANGRMWSAEQIANTFIGPPLGSLLLIVAFSLPFFVDAASFFAAAALVWSIPGSFRAERPDDHVQAPWKSELAEGFRWLWAHHLLRSMAIILGFMNLASDTQRRGARAVRPRGPRRRSVRVHDHGLRVRDRRDDRRLPRPVDVEAVRQRHVPRNDTRLERGDVVGRRRVVVVADGDDRLDRRRPRSARRGTSSPSACASRSSPPHLLGRVNSVYRFFAWGMIPIGAFLGGATVTVRQPVREPCGRPAMRIPARRPHLPLLVHRRSQQADDGKARSGQRRRSLRKLAATMHTATKGPTA